MVAERLKLQYIVGTFGGLECAGLLGIFFIFYFYVRYSTTASSTTPQIPLCRRMLRLGLPSKFRSEKILWNRLRFSLFCIKILHCTWRCLYLRGTLCSSYIEILTNNVHSVRRALTKLPIRKLPAFARTCLFPVQTGFWFSQKFFSMYAIVFILLHSTKCMSCSSILLVLPACSAYQVC
jgi:hypothetical protein